MASGNQCGETKRREKEKAFSSETKQTVYLRQSSLYIFSTHKKELEIKLEQSSSRVKQTGSNLESEYLQNSPPALIMTDVNY